MCKFDSDTSPGFEKVTEVIQRYSEDSPDIIKSRWKLEREERTTQRIHKAQEIFPFNPDMIAPLPAPASDSASTPSLTPGSSVHNLLDYPDSRNKEPARSSFDLPSPTKPADPYFIVPPDFRENTFFFGMEKELQDIGKKLFNNKRRQKGTACVLLHGPAGAGKSHLARQYVSTNRNKFKGGIFWLNARLKGELHRDYWQIAQKVISRDSPELRVSSNETVELVKTWFESREEWLIVLDGLDIDTEKDAMELEQFIPNRSNTSLIYVSMAKKLESMHRLHRPSAIKVPPLSERDARRLLFKEIQIRNPNDAQRKRATELVKQVGGLPLAINAISHRLADTHERLENYKITSYSADPKLAVPYRQIMKDLQERGYLEAYNLINILCFFGSHIPVEMVHLGMKALKNVIEIRSSLHGEKRDINITIGTLIRYALIERNEPDDNESMTSSRDSFVDPEPIDMLSLHGVVQNFCCDALKAKGEVPTWAGYAVQLFCHSYKDACNKIRSSWEPGRVSDYREYLNHGHYLRCNLAKYGSKSNDLSEISDQLEVTIANIEDQIRLREPNSSQESVHRTEAQVSIFNRSSSSSSSAYSDPTPKTPEERPTRPSLSTENKYGLPADKPSIDSPGSLGKTSPVYAQKGIDHTDSTYTYLPIYQTAPEYLPQSHPMQDSLSEAPAHLNSGRFNESWEVGTTPKQRPQSARRYLGPGAYKPVPVHPELNTGYAIGYVVPRPAEHCGMHPRSSDAITSLTAVHHATPPPPKGSTTIEPQGPSSSSSTPTINQSSYIEVLTGQPLRPFSSQGLISPDQRLLSDAPFVAQIPSLSPSAATEQERPRESVVFRTDSPQQSSVRMQVVPVIPSDQELPAPFPLSLIRRTSRSTPNLLAYAVQTPHLSQVYHSPVPTSPSPSPFPFESNVSVTSKRHAPSDTSSPSRPSTACEPTRTPPTAYQSTYPTSSGFAPFTPLQGYYSQPTSRNPPGQSHTLVAQTEPPLVYPSSSRTRYSDGSPVNKSPKLGSAYMVVAPGTSRSDGYDVSPHNSTYLTNTDPALLSGTGEWASLPQSQGTIQFQPHLSPGHSNFRSSPPNVPVSMSRGSPGSQIAMETVSGERRSSGLAEVGPYGEVVLGQFGSVRIEDARRAQERLQEIATSQSRSVIDKNMRNEILPVYHQPLLEEQGYYSHGPSTQELPTGLGIYPSPPPIEPRNMYGRNSAPYPETNRILTESDPRFSIGMTTGGRSRGWSASGTGPVIENTLETTIVPGYPPR